MLPSHGIYFQYLFRMMEWLDLSGRLKKINFSKRWLLCIFFLYFFSVFFCLLLVNGLEERILITFTFDVGRQMSHSLTNCEVNRESENPLSQKNKTKQKNWHTYSRWCQINLQFEDTDCFVKATVRSDTKRKKRKLLLASITHAFPSCPLWLVYFTFL